MSLFLAKHLWGLRGRAEALRGQGKGLPSRESGGDLKVTCGPDRGVVKLFLPKTQGFSVKLLIKRSLFPGSGPEGGRKGGYNGVKKGKMGEF